LRKASWVLVAILVLSLSLAAGAAQDTARQREYRLKAVFIYNFIKFVDGFRFEQPQPDQGEQKGHIILGIVGEDPFEDAFDPLLEKPVGQRYLRVRRITVRPDPNDQQSVDPNGIKILRQCNILFIAGPERPRIDAILKAVRNEPVLTIADQAGFLDAGGIINLGIEENKVFFEINLAAAERANLTLRSQLLRLAKRVIRQDKHSRG